MRSDIPPYKLVEHPAVQELLLGYAEQYLQHMDAARFANQAFGQAEPADELRFTNFRVRTTHGRGDDFLPDRRCHDLRDIREGEYWQPVRAAFAGGSEDVHIVVVAELRPTPERYQPLRTAIQLGVSEELLREALDEDDPEV